MELKQAIRMYCEAMSYNDKEFAENYKNNDKSLDECILFIQSEMLKKVSKEQKKGAACVVPSDDEVFALAVRYYNDKDIKIDGTAFDNVKVLSVSATSFTEDEKKQMRQEAIQKYQQEVIDEMKKKDAEAKAKKAKAKKQNPVLLPDTPATKEEGSESETTKTQKTVQLSLF